MPFGSFQRMQNSFEHQKKEHEYRLRREKELVQQQQEISQLILTGNVDGLIKKMSPYGYIRPIEPNLKGGNTPLNFAIINHKYDVAEVLMEKGAAITCKNSENKTAVNLVEDQLKETKNPDEGLLRFSKLIFAKRDQEAEETALKIDKRELLIESFRSGLSAKLGVELEIFDRNPGYYGRHVESVLYVKGQNEVRDKNDLYNYDFYSKDKLQWSLSENGRKVSYNTAFVEIQGWDGTITIRSTGNTQDYNVSFASQYTPKIKTERKILGIRFSVWRPMTNEIIDSVSEANKKSNEFRFELRQ